MTPEEKLELAELFAYRTRSKFDLRRDRLVAAEMRLVLDAMDGNGCPLSNSEHVSLSYKTYDQ